jgi:hypothetical protein
MRPVLICVSLVAGLVLAGAAFATKTPIPSSLTVILDFHGTRSDQSIREMEKESGAILKTTGLHLDWRLRSQSGGQIYPALVVMQFNGACKYDPAPRPYDRFGPLASTKTTDHEIQSFAEVDCDHVAETARKAMQGLDYQTADLLVGRALGRVVVHELVHMLTHSPQHGKDGVFEAALSGKQLIAPTLPLDSMDVNRLMSGFEGDQAE